MELRQYIILMRQCNLLFFNIKQFTIKKSTVYKLITLL